MPSSPLLVVELVLRYKQQDGAVDPLGRLIADYLGPDRNLPLGAACRFESTTLLDWMWECSPTSATERSRGWTLLNYLRSDPHYYQYQFQESIGIAAEDGNANVVEWLMEHFSGCEVPTSVVEDAAEGGWMDVLQTLLKHDAGSKSFSRKKRKLGTEGTETVKDRGGGNVVRWGGRLLKAACRRHFDAVRFLYKNTPRGHYEHVYGTIAVALHAGEMDIVNMLLPPGKSALEYGKLSTDPVLVERRFEAGLLDDVASAAEALGKLVKSGRLDLMQRIWKKFELPVWGSEWMENWMKAIATACKMGRLAILQWLVEHPAGRAAVSVFKVGDDLPSLLYDAVSQGHLDVMQYLYDQDVAFGYGAALLCAIRGDKTAAAKWLLDHFPPTEKIPQYCVLVEAARYGRVEMLEYLQGAESLEVPGFPGSKPSSIPESSTEFAANITDAGANRYSGTSAADDTSSSSWEWLPTDAMDDAAGNGQLEAVQWLHKNRSEGCTFKAMDEAAEFGHLEVVKWLHLNRPEGCTSWAIGAAAANGRLEVVKWLYEYRSDRFTYSKVVAFAGVYDSTEVVKWLVLQSPKESKNIAMDDAITNGDFALVQWLHTQVKARCTVKAMTTAAEAGHLKILKYLYAHRPRGPALQRCAIAAERALATDYYWVAYWCLRHFPLHSPTSIKISSRTRFETLLFVRWRYPEMFAAAFVANIREALRSSEEASIIDKWLGGQLS